MPGQIEEISKIRMQSDLNLNYFLICLMESESQSLMVELCY